MQNMGLLRKLLALTFLGLAMSFPLESGGAIAQQNSEILDHSLSVVQFQRLSIHKLLAVSESKDVTKLEDLELSPLSLVEEDIARNLNSHWAWAEFTLEMIDSYSPFLFRTKRSQGLDEVKIILDVNSKGRVSGFEILGEVDNGLKERLDHMIRKLPNCKPVPGFANYSPERFELTIRK